MPSMRVEKTTLFAPWSLRLVALAVQLLLATLVLHRFAAMTTGVAINLMLIAFVAAGFAGISGLAGLVQVWRHGFMGALGAGAALCLGVALLAIPAYYMPFALRGGAYFDVSTDPANPPQFHALAKLRAAAGVGNLPQLNANGQAAADAGDHRTAPKSDALAEPVLTARSPSDVFDLTNDLLRQLDLNIIAEQAPGFGEEDGTIEASEKTMVLGLIDDISIRISARNGATRVDIRSAARYPRLDLGRNGERVQLIARKLQANIDASVPTDDASQPAVADASKAAITPADGTGPGGQALHRKRRLLAPSNAQGGPAPTVSRH